WSEYKKGKWGAKKITKEAYVNKSLTDNIHISIDSEVNNGKLSIRLYYAFYYYYGFSKQFSADNGIIYEFDDCNSFSKSVKSVNYQTKVYTPSGASPVKMKISELDGSINKFNLFKDGIYSEDVSSLSQTIFQNVDAF